MGALLKLLFLVTLMMVTLGLLDMYFPEVLKLLSEIARLLPVIAVVVAVAFWIFFAKR